MTLWDWAVRAYRRPGVEELCLRLQDDHGQCIAYLVWAGWAAENGRAVSESDRKAAAAMARDWETTITGPLRSVRRALKSPRPDPTAAAQEALRRRLQDDELAAERLILDALEARTLGVSNPAYPATTLSGAASAWNPPPPRDLLEALGHAFSNP